MLMSLGLFVFTLKSVPFQKIDRQTRERWAKSERFGAPAATQHIGPGDDTITLSGVLLPQLTGGPVHLETLRTMKSGGKAWILAQGDGRILGMWYIEAINETQTHFTTTGKAKKIEFTLILQRYGEEIPDMLGDLADSL